jgi:hypothetical protein
MARSGLTFPAQGTDPSALGKDPSRPREVPFPSGDQGGRDWVSGLSALGLDPLRARIEGDATPDMGGCDWGTSLADQGNSPLRNDRLLAKMMAFVGHRHRPLPVGRPRGEGPLSVGVRISRVPNFSYGLENLTGQSGLACLFGGH